MGSKEVAKINTTVEEGRSRQRIIERVRERYRERERKIQRENKRYIEREKERGEGQIISIKGEDLGMRK